MTTIATEVAKDHERGICALSPEGTETVLYCLRPGGENIEEMELGEHLMEAWVCPNCGPVFVNFLTVSKVDEETGSLGFQVRTDWQY